MITIIAGIVVYIASGITLNVVIDDPYAKIGE